MCLLKLCAPLANFFILWDKIMLILCDHVWAEYFKQTWYSSIKTLSQVLAYSSRCYSLGL